MNKLVAVLASLPLFATATAFAQPAVTAPSATPVVATVTAPATVIVMAPTATPATVAAPAAAPAGSPAPAAPQSDDWKNVSNINGQLVKVGERTDYLFKNPKVNISTDPISWLFGLYGASVSYAVSNNVAIRADVNVMQSHDDLSNESGYEVGLSAPIYLKRVYRGPFIEPGVIVHKTTDNDECAYDGGGNSCTSPSNTLTGPEMLVGWHWSFDSGLNVAIAFGAAKDMNHHEDDESSSVAPEGYFRVGYEF